MNRSKQDKAKASVSKNELLKKFIGSDISFETTSTNYKDALKPSLKRDNTQRFEINTH